MCAASSVFAFVWKDYVLDKPETEVECQGKIAQTIRKMCNKCFMLIAGLARLFQERV